MAAVDERIEVIAKWRIVPLISSSKQREALNPTIEANPAAMNGFGSVSGDVQNRSLRVLQRLIGAGEQAGTCIIRSADRLRISSAPRPVRRLIMLIQKTIFDHCDGVRISVERAFQFLFAANRSSERNRSSPASRNALCSPESFRRTSPSGTLLPVGRCRNAQRGSIIVIASRLDLDTIKPERPRGFKVLSVARRFVCHPSSSPRSLVYEMRRSCHLWRACHSRSILPPASGNRAGGSRNG